MNLPSPQTVKFSLRFSEETFAQIKKVAKQNKTTPSKVIRYFTEEALKEPLENK